MKIEFKRTRLVILTLATLLVFAFVAARCRSAMAGPVSPTPAVTTAVGEVSGCITDKYSGYPVGNVWVACAGKQTNSDSNGNYWLSEISEGNHSIRAEKEGYYNYSASITITKGGNTTHNFNMEKSN